MDNWTRLRRFLILGRGSWAPVREIVDALDAAFYTSFGNVEPAGKRLLHSATWMQRCASYVTSMCSPVYLRICAGI